MTRGVLMDQEIRQQVEVLAQGARKYRETLAPLRAREYEMVLLAARGSSDNAALYGRYLIEIFLGLPVSLAAPSVLTRFNSKVRYPRCLAIGISQSGAAPDVAEVLAALRDQGHTTLAITNTEGSRLTEEAEFSLLLETGKEQSVAATKTLSSSFLAMAELVRVLGGSVPETIDNTPTDSWVNQMDEYAQASCGHIVRCAPLFALGRGYGFSTAHETALKLMECALLSCKAYSSADFEHGPKALAGYGSCAISFDGPMKDLAAQGCMIVKAPKKFEDDHPFAALEPIWDIIFGQFMALHAARARGLDPDHPQYLRKITETL